MKKIDQRFLNTSVLCGGLGMGMLKKEPKLANVMYTWKRPNVEIEENVKKVMANRMYVRYSKHIKSKIPWLQKYADEDVNEITRHMRHQDMVANMPTE